MRHHAHIGLDASDEAGARGAQLLHQRLQLTLELAAHADEREFAAAAARGAANKQGLDEPVLALLIKKNMLSCGLYELL